LRDGLYLIWLKLIGANFKAIEVADYIGRYKSETAAAHD
jgi:hypothetical protein